MAEVQKMGLLKKLAIAAGAFVALLLLLAILVPFVLPMEKIKNIAAQKASEALHRDVTIQGVSFNLFKGIVLTGLRVGDRKGFGAEPFVSADEIRVRYSFLSLLRMKPVIGSVRLVKPVFRVSRSDRGELSVADLAGGAAAGAASQKPEKASGPPPEILIASVKVLDGTVSFQDSFVSKGKTIETKIAKLECDLGNLTLTGTMTYRIRAELAEGKISLDGSVALPSLAVKLKFGLEGLRPGAMDDALAAYAGFRSAAGVVGVTVDASVADLKKVGLQIALRLDKLTLGPAAGGKALISNLTLPVDVSLEGTLDKAVNAFSLEKLGLSVPGVAVSGKGKVTGLSGAPSPDLALEVRVDLDKIGAFGGAMLPPEVRLSGSLGCDVTVKGRMDALQVAGTLKGSPAGFAYGQAASKSAGTELTAAFHAALGKSLVVSLDEFKFAEIKGPKGNLLTNLVASASLDGHKAKFAVRADKLDGTVMMAAAAAASGAKPEAGAKPAAPASAAPTALPGALTKQVRQAADGIPMEMTVDGTVKVSEFSYEDYRASDFSCAIKLARRVLSLEPVAMKAYGGTVGVNARVDLSQEPVAGKVRFDVKNVEANGFLKATSKSAEGVYGTLGMAGDVVFRGVEGDAMKKSVNGLGNFAVRDGKLQNLPVLRSLGQALGKSLPEEIRYRALTASWRIKDGVVETNDLKLDGDDLRGTGTVRANLAGPLSGRISTRFSPDLTGRIGFPYGRDRDGWTSLSFDLGGTVDKPAVKVDLAALLQKTGENLLKDKAGSELKKGLEKLLGRP